MNHHRRTPAVELLEDKALMSSLALTVRTPHPPIAITPRDNQGLKIQLRTDHSVYHLGQPVVMTLTMTNPTSRNVAVGLGPSIDGFFVTQQGSEVWASNTGPQPLFILLRTIRPGQSVTLSATWDGHSNLGPPSTPTGTLVVHSQIGGAPAATIQILSS
jgi:hypothetical protein